MFRVYCHSNQWFHIIVFTEIMLEFDFFGIDVLSLYYYYYHLMIIIIILNYIVPLILL